MAFYNGGKIGSQEWPWNNETDQVCPMVMYYEHERGR